MKTSANQIITILRCYLKGQQIEYRFTPESFKELTMLAGNQQVLLSVYDALLSCRVTSHEGDEAYMTVMRQYTIQKSLIFNKTYEIFPRIIEALDNSEMDYRILKGQTIRNDYPNPNVRIMSDLDILIREKDREAVGDLLKSLGYHHDINTDYEYDDAYCRDGSIGIELHHRLSLDHLIGDVRTLEQAILEDQNCCKYDDGYNGTYKAPSPSEHIAYLILHAAKHMWGSGIYIRLLFDIAVFISKEECDWHVVETYVQELGLEKVAPYILMMVYRWFDVESSYSNREIDENLYDEIVELVFEKQAEGQSYSLSYFEAAYRRYLHDAQGFSLKDRLRIIFPAKSMLGWRYTYAKDSMLLLPVAWFHRIIYECIFQKNRTIAALKYRPNSDNIMKKALLYNKLGIVRTQQYRR